MVSWPPLQPLRVFLLWQYFSFTLNCILYKPSGNCSGYLKSGIFRVLQFCSVATFPTKWWLSFPPFPPPRLVSGGLKSFLQFVNISILLICNSHNLGGEWGILEAFFPGEEGFHCSHTPTPPPSGRSSSWALVEAQKYSFSSSLALGERWEPWRTCSQSNFSLEQLGLLITDFRKGSVTFCISCNLRNSLCFIHQALVQPFLGKFVFSLFVWSLPNKKTLRCVTSWPSLGWIPTEKRSWGISRAASSPPYGGFCWLLEFSLCSQRQQENSWLSWIQFGLSKQIISRSRV